MQAEAAHAVVGLVHFSPSALFALRLLCCTSTTARSVPANEALRASVRLCNVRPGLGPALRLHSSAQGRGIAHFSDAVAGNKLPLCAGACECGGKGKGRRQQSRLERAERRG